MLQDLSAFLGIPPGRSRKTLHLLWNPYSATEYQIFLRALPSLVRVRQLRQLC